MKYCLTVQLDKEFYEVKGFSKIVGFEYISEDKLQGIVEFTNSFEHEQELVSYLISKNLLPEKFFKGNVFINYYKGKNTPPKTLQYGVSFMEDKKYFDIIFLRHYFCNHFTNQEFMKLFIKKYFNYLKDISIFSKHIYYVKCSYEYFVEYGVLPEDAYNEMAKFVELYCSKKSKNGYYKADFTRIRDLAMFTINYERDSIRMPIERPEHTIKELEPIIMHYHELLKNDTLTEDEILVYKNAITSLEKELEYTKKVTRNRSIKHEITNN